MPVAASTLNSRLGIQNRRTIFSSNYIGLDNFLRERSSLILKYQAAIGSQNEAHFKESFREDFETKGLSSIFSEDIGKFIDVADSPEDLRLLYSILIACIDSDSRFIFNLTQLINMYFLLCYHLDTVEEAINMWKDPSFGNSTYKSHGIIKLRYLMVLYNNQKYQEIVDEVREPGAKFFFDHYTVAMAALAKLTTTDSLTEAKNMCAYVKIHCRGKFGRFLFLYAWKAYNMGEFGLAHDLLDQRKIGPLYCNLKVAVLADTKRIGDAFQVLRSTLLSPGPDGQIKRGIISFQVMKKLADCVSVHGDEASRKELAVLCADLDRLATMSNDSLEQMVFQLVDSKRKDTSPRKRKHRRARDLEHND